MNVHDSFLTNQYFVLHVHALVLKLDLTSCSETKTSDVLEAHVFF